MGKWTHRVADALAGMGHEPTLWFADEFRALQKMRRTSVLAFPVALARRILKSRSKFDAVVIHEPSGWAYGLLRRMSSGFPPMILMCHGVETRIYAQNLAAAARGLATVPFSTRIKAPLIRLWQSRLAARLADSVVCLSTADREYLISHVGLPDSRVVLMVNGVDRTEIIDPQSKAPAATCRLLFVGGWLDNKGRRFLPVIWPLVRKEFPSAMLTLIGTGADRETVLRDFREQDRASVTVVPRVITPAIMRKEFASHGIFLMPSVSEGSPLALLEAMAAGMPVVAANVGGIPDIVTNGVNGLLFESMDAGAAADRVCTVLRNPTMASEIGWAARNRAAELTWRSSAETLMGAIETALSYRSIFVQSEQPARN
jgi:glycosyltransferase involved in cell wall biosynthesis